MTDKTNLFFTGFSRLSLPALSGLILIQGLLSCSAVQEIPNHPLNNEKLPRVKFLSRTKTVLNKARDYKLRTRTLPGYRIFIKKNLELKGVAPEDVKIAVEQTLNLIRFRDVKFLKPPEKMKKLPGFPESDETLAYLRKVQADAVAEITLKPGEKNSSSGGEGGEKIIQSFTVHLRLLDPVGGHAIAERRIRAEVAERRMDSHRQAEFVISGGRFYFPREKRDRFVRIVTGDKKSFRHLLRNVKTGNLIVYAGSQEASIYLRRGNSRVFLGRSSANRVLTEGKYRIEVIRRGAAPIIKDVWVRAGRSSRIFAHGVRVSGAAVYSEPEGLRLAQDGVIRGRTPLYLSNLSPGVYGIEISRPDKKGRYEVVSEADVKVESNKPVSRVFFINYRENFSGDLLSKQYWRLASEEGRVNYVPRNGLGFRSLTRLNVWQGLVSRPFSMTDFRLDIDVVQKKGTRIAYGVMTPSQSALVELNSGIYSVRLFNGRNPESKRRAFKALKEGEVHRLSFVYHHKEKKLRIMLDGGTVFSGTWNPSSAGRIALLAHSRSADGRTLARSLRMKSGRGIYD